MVQTDDHVFWVTSHLAHTVRGRLRGVLSSYNIVSDQHNTMSHLPSPVDIELCIFLTPFAAGLNAKPHYLTCLIGIVP